ncbi:hypothetical protein SUGI_0117010 [Cryptomeria japonica]|nr:hypothetical protein SUGI_0117010 [Cryptomeria japonica]
MGEIEREGRSNGGPRISVGEMDDGEDLEEDNLLGAHGGRLICYDFGLWLGSVSCISLGFVDLLHPLLDNPSLVSLTSMVLKVSRLVVVFCSLRSHDGGLFSLFPLSTTWTCACRSSLISLLVFA